LLLQPKILLQQPNVLLIELNILLLGLNIFVIPILTNDFVGITKPFIPCAETGGDFVQEAFSLRSLVASHVNALRAAGLETGSPRSPQLVSGNGSQLL